MLSIVTPAFHEAKTLPVLRERLQAHLAAYGLEWEWIIVDDGSADDTYALVSQWARKDPRIRGARLSRNFGSHAALACGLRRSRGDAIVFLGADLQEPAELVGELEAQWKKGKKVVWAVPERERPSPVRRIFYSLLRRGEGLGGQPLNGANAVLIDRQVAEVLIAGEENHSNLFARIRLAGFDQGQLSYHRAERLAGASGWTLRKKIKLALDSLTGFDHALVRGMTYLGVLAAASGFALAMYVIALAFGGKPPTGWSSLMVVTLLLGGAQMLFLGILGEYAWRTLEQTRGRPLYVMECSTDIVRRAQGSAFSNISEAENRVRA